MPVSFFETMSGELRDSQGSHHHVAVDLRLEAGSFTRFLTDGRTRLTGTIRALPWTDGAAVTGEVIVLPLTKRLIRYRMRFVDVHGGRWRLEGQKNITWGRGYLASQTTMHAHLYQDDQSVATGDMQFFMNSVVEFMLSWKPWTALRPANTPSSGASPLSAVRRRQLLAVAEAVVVPTDRVPAADERTIDRLQEQLSHMPVHISSGLRAALTAWDVRIRLRAGRPFRSLDLGTRRELVQATVRKPSSGAARALAAIATLVRSAHFGRADYLSAIGFPTPTPSPVVLPEPKWQANVMAPTDLAVTDSIECDVVVVGSGAGGAPLAARLAESGLGVVIVEEGPLTSRHDFRAHPDDRRYRYWHDAGATFALGNAVVTVPTARLVGGTTAINSGTCFRTPDAVLAQWRHEKGLGSDFTPEAFGKYLDAVEVELDVADAEQSMLGRVSTVMATGAEAIGAHHGPLPRNAPACDGQGTCVFGCPTDAKRSTNVSWIPRAMTAGAALVTEMSLTRILMHGNRAIGVLAHGHTPDGSPRTLEVRARAVVIAAGTLRTPLLLQENNIDLPALGTNLSIHPAVSVLGLMDGVDDKRPWQSIPQGYHVFGHGDPRISYEGVNSPPSLGAAALPFVGSELSRWMDSWDRVEHFGLMVRDEGVGRVYRGPGGRPLIRYSVTRRTQALVQEGIATVSEMFLHGGATEVAHRIEGIPTVTSVAAARDLAKYRIAPSRITMAGFHPLGTAQMGTDPRRAVLDQENRVFGYSGLYVVDGSAVPTSLGVNPQLTIMALSLRAADIISDRLKR
ncbi:GMC family oxidoreductase N-terminal domain-containing protein [Nocardia sp. CA-107356]|uniref:GMC family oxidoreductase N-terminal domain-containing protein n=1 Tax=Nocardia sp. CA-107356 TaxID=3239972 RepID=UPI003D8CDA19